jgi:hypothetical protein
MNHTTFSSAIQEKGRSIKKALKMMKTITSILILFVLVQEGLGFTTSRNIATSKNGLSVSRQLFMDPSASSQTTSAFEETADEGVVIMSSSSSEIQRKNGLERYSLPSFVGFVTGIASYAAQGIAADDYEVVELPPP